MEEITPGATPITPGPRVSVIMANYNGAAHIVVAVRSVLRQTLTSLELIVSDDGSSDESVARAEAAAAGDQRLTILRHAAPSGPAAARNRALALARGDWIAIVDSDDFLDPERLARLVDAAERDGADIAADDMLVFYENDARAPHAHLHGDLARAPQWISPARYVDSNVLNGSAPSLGYLKPVIRRALLACARYDETMPIAEDYDLILRLLKVGARMRVYPDLGYFYRKHAGSISHRLSALAIDRMITAHAAGPGPGDDQALVRALARRAGSLKTARAFADLIEALKRKKIGQALAICARRPAAALLLRQPILARLAPQRAAPTQDDTPHIALLSRQRIVGATNGSSAYVLSIVRALKDAGYRVDYIGASPKVFGRWPFLRLRPEISVFDSYSVHGGVRIGATIIATDPRIAFRAGLAVLRVIAAKLKLVSGPAKPAPHGIAAEATRADRIYVARQTHRPARAVLCDYAFLAPLAPFALAADAPSVIIMHDLMSARVNAPGAENAPREITELTAVREFHLLSLTDAIAAIQAEEAEATRAKLPTSDVMVAPMAADIVASAQPGEDDKLLFVGSNTAPNVSGLEWFLAECWPRIRAARPQAELSIAGSVGRAMGAPPEGVRMLGVVPSLDPLYRDAGLVISPLRTGSGLKIKLIEALAAGKAVIGTSVTAQGLTTIAAQGMVIADDAHAFADAVIERLGDPAMRAVMGAAAQRIAAEHFSAAACYGPLIRYIESAHAQ